MSKICVNISIRIVVMKANNFSFLFFTSNVLL